MSAEFSPFSIRRALSVALVAASLAVPQAVGAADLEKAQAFFEQGDFRSAQIELKGILQADPTQVAARELLGRLYLAVGNGAAAEKEFRSAVESGAEPSATRFEIIEAMLLQGKFPEVLEHLDGEAEDDAARARQLALRGRALFGLKKIDEAERAYQESLEIDSNNKEANLGLIRVSLMQNLVEEAREATDKFLETSPDDLDALLIKAELTRKEGDAEQAAEIFGRILDDEPQNLGALLGRASSLIAAREYERARADIKRAQQLRPGLPMADHLLAVIARLELKWDEAAEHLEKVLAVAPDYAPSLRLLGIVSYAKDELQKAEELLSRALAQSPGDLEVAKVLAATRLKLREPEKAVEILAPYMGATNDPQLMALLGSAHMLAGQQSEGQEWLARAVESAPDVAALRTQLALTMLAGGKVDDAIGELESAVDLDQDVLQADVLLVLALLREKSFDKALEASAALEERMPESPIPFNLTGLAYLAQGNGEAAIERFNKALEVDPKFVTALINLARVDLADGRLDDAESRYRTALEQDHTHLGAMLGLAALAEKRKDMDGLVEWLNKAQDANPSASQPGILLVRYHITHGDYLKALSVGSDLAARFPDKPEVLEMFARAQTLAGEETNAVRTFERLLDLKPSNPQLHYLMGGALWKNKDYLAAADAFRKAVELKPGFVDARVALASVLIDGGEGDDALKVAKQLQNDLPDKPVGYQIAGAVEMERRNFKQAAAYFEQAVERGRTPSSLRRLAESYGRAGDRAKAIEVLEGWAKDSPDDLGAKAMLALYYQGAGRDEEALVLYEELNKTGRKNLVLLNNLAWMLHERGDPRALSIAKEAYDLNPNRPEVADTYGWILFNANREEEGLTILQQAHLAYPTQTEIAFHVGSALHRLGRSDEAVRILKRLVREHPGSADAKKAQGLLDQIGS